MLYLITARVGEMTPHTLKRLVKIGFMKWGSIYFHEFN